MPGEYHHLFTLGHPPIPLYKFVAIVCKTLWTFDILRSLYKLMQQFMYGNRLSRSSLTSFYGTFKCRPGSLYACL